MRRPVGLLGVGAAAALALAGCAGSAPQASESAASNAPVPSAPAETSAPTATAGAPSESAATPVETVLTMSALGDMLPHQTILDGASTGAGWDFAPYFTDVAPILGADDLTACNLEAPVAGDALGVRAYPAFDAPATFAAGIVGAGCDALSLANNHAMDAGVEGIRITRDVLDGLDVVASGTARTAAEQLAPAIADVQGVRVAFVSVTDLTNVAAPPQALTMLSNRPVVEQLMATAREQADVVVVAAHWGVEYSPTVHASQRQSAEWLASLGADVILGHHPHVLEPVEWVERADGGRTLVWYSLGNALSSQVAIPRVFSAIAQFDVAVAPDGAVEVRDPRAIPIYMHFDWSPEDAAAGRLETRADPHLYLLRDAAEPLTRSAWRTTVDEQRAAIAAALGPEVRLEQ